MDFTNLKEHYHELLDYLREEENGSERPLQLVRGNIYWILENEKHNTWQSYAEVYDDRVSKLGSERYKRTLKATFDTIQDFDFYGKYPNRNGKNKNRGAYHQLVPEFKEAINVYKASAKLCDVKESTINKQVSAASCFFFAMQQRGGERLDCIDEADVISFFLDEEGNVSKSGSYKDMIAAVLKTVAGWKEKECRAILAYLPLIRYKRKNIRYLTQEEVGSIRMVLDDDGSGLSLREKAIGKLLFFTGMRACDIAGMKLSSIDWGAEEIYIVQQKTGHPIVLPLTAAIGNPIYDYLMEERPESDDGHLFLGKFHPHYPLKAATVGYLSNKIYAKAAIRQNKGDRRGTHLFRHNAATSFLGSGVPRPVISQTLGHTDPLSLEPYLHADLVHLKMCALSIEWFPVSEEVFSL